MKLRHFGIAVMLGASAMIHASRASQLDDLEVEEPGSDRGRPRGGCRREAAAAIYQSAANGMSERQIVLAEALDDSERSREIRSRVSADGKRFHAFLIGKDGHVALLVGQAAFGGLPVPANRCDADAPGRDGGRPLIVCRDF